MQQTRDVTPAWVQRRVVWHSRVHDVAVQPLNASPWLSPLRRWQWQRLGASFADLLAVPRTQAAAAFFLSDLYADRDFSGRDEGVARVVPLMSRLLPNPLLRALGEAVELGALSHALDLRMVRALERNARASVIDQDSYAAAYRAAGCARLRQRQIGLIVAVGQTLDRAVHKRGVDRLLRASRMPARLAGLGDLQAFLERGFAAFRQLDGADDFLDTIATRERAVSRRLFGGDPQPFAALDQANSSSR